MIQARDIRLLRSGTEIDSNACVCSGGDGCDTTQTVTDDAKLASDADGNDQLAATVPS